MAGDNEEGNGNRATIALVSSQVTGLHELMRAELGAVQRQLDAVVGLPLIVNGMMVTLTRLDHEAAKMKDIPGRVKRLEDLDVLETTEAQQRRAYRITTLPMILLALVGTFFAAFGVVIAYLTYQSG